jgi:hypothetical protein
MNTKTKPLFAGAPRDIVQLQMLAICEKEGVSLHLHFLDIGYYFSRFSSLSAKNLPIF